MPVGGMLPIAGSGGDDPEHPPDGCAYTCSKPVCGEPIQEPELIATTPFEQQIVTLATGGDYLYFGTLSNQLNGGEIGRLPLTGGAVELLVTGVQVAALAVDDQNLYYVDRPDSGGSKATTLPLSGGQSTSITLFEPTPTRFLDAARLSHNWVYFHQHNPPNTIKRASLLDSSQELLLETPGVIWGFVADGNQLFWSEWRDENQASSLLRRDLMGGDPEVAFEIPSLLVDPIIDDGDTLVFSSSYADACRGNIHTLDKASGEATTLSPERAGRQVYALTADTDAIYWGNAGLEAGVWSYMKSSGRTWAMAAGQRSVQAITVSATTIYWVTSDGSADQHYEIRAVSKP